MTGRVLEFLTEAGLAIAEALSSRPPTILQVYDHREKLVAQVHRRGAIRRRLTTRRFLKRGYTVTEVHSDALADFPEFDHTR